MNESLRSAPLCACGCGQPVKRATKTRKGRAKKGKWNKFIRYHNGKANRTDGGIPYTVDSESGCWNWNGEINNVGRPKMYLPGSVNKRVIAYRYYYEQTKGPIPEGLQIDHLCFNPKCVNPEHLEAVTPEENYRRRDEQKALNEETEEGVYL